MSKVLAGNDRKGCKLTASEQQKYIRWSALAALCVAYWCNASMVGKGMKTGTPFSWSILECASAVCSSSSWLSCRARTPALYWLVTHVYVPFPTPTKHRLYLGHGSFYPVLLNSLSQNASVLINNAHYTEKLRDIGQFYRC